MAQRKKRKNKHHNANHSGKGRSVKRTNEFRSFGEFLKENAWILALITVVVNLVTPFCVPFLQSYLDEKKQQESAIPLSEMVRTDLATKINTIKDTFHPENISALSKASSYKQLYASYKELQQDALNLTMLEEVEEPVFSIDESFVDSLSLSVINERLLLRQKYKSTIESIFSDINAIFHQLDSIPQLDKNYDSALIMQKYRYSKAKMDNWITLHEYQTNHLKYRYDCYLQNTNSNNAHKTSDTLASILKNCSDNVTESNYLKNDFYGFIMSFNEFMSVISRNLRANIQ